MSKSSHMFLDAREENYFQEKGYIDEEKNAYIRSLWSDIEDEKLVKDKKVQSKSITLFQRKEGQNLQPDYV